MPTTRPRSLRLAGAEVSITLDRLLAERVKAAPLVRWLRGAPAGPDFRDDEPAVAGMTLDDIDWYHTIDLGHGVVTTGLVDYRSRIGEYQIPASLASMRCLDVGTGDGFWAFEMEKRGAGEVVAIDVFGPGDWDFPSNWHREWREHLSTRPSQVEGYGFAYARRALRSRVRRRLLSVYELAPERVGTFDFVMLSDLLLDLRDPLRALEAVWTVARPGAMLVAADRYDAELERAGQANAVRLVANLQEGIGFCWWRSTASALATMLRLARFQDVQQVAQYDLQTRDGTTNPRVIFTARREEAHGCRQPKPAGTG
jgi:tRNA (mo5U34)-methyltransferase